MLVRRSAERRAQGWIFVREGANDVKRPGGVAPLGGRRFRSSSFLLVSCWSRMRQREAQSAPPHRVASLLERVIHARAWTRDLLTGATEGALLFSALLF